jgi:hypothetical protein
LKFFGDQFKRVCQNILVDIASLVFISAALYFISLAGFTLYSSYYRTQGLPTPDSFSMATFQMSSAISSVFAVFFTRKYRCGKKEEEKEEKKGN